MKLDKWIKEAEVFSADFFKEDSTGHDWFHTDRVRKLAAAIAEEEGADKHICELAALLHDIGDEKFHRSEREGKQFLNKWMVNRNMPRLIREQLEQIIYSVSYKGGNGEVPDSLEARIVQDADRLDAIGAVGIARCFMYAGSHGSPMHIPQQLPRHKMSQEEYRDHTASAVNHFYEKLLKLKTLMNTESGKKRADQRHVRLENFLSDFYSEWEGNS